MCSLAPAPGVCPALQVPTLHRTDKGANRRAHTHTEAVAFLGAMTHFSSQRILGRRVRSQADWSLRLHFAERHRKRNDAADPETPQWDVGSVLTAGICGLGVRASGSSRFVQIG